MAKVVREAKANNDNINDTINAYTPIKLEKIKRGVFDQYTDMATKAGYVAAIFGFFIILCVLSLVLMLIAIEKNTRSSALVLLQKAHTRPQKEV